ncbi:hypothetical protein C9218_13550 [Escherichia coli]|nr:hypothetical protein [Escherichia coli]EFI6965650.1 hypothetical protein [Escherichia coli]TJA55959.1 hypothetical protein C9310_08870 [Escherichia coli]TJE36413.1 hypothetical protein C9218_13550 [Escherichia coli]TJE51170.1 hypothetical protein C9214_13915 [Escherichia coli]
MITSRYNDEVFSEGIIVATKMWMIRGDGGKLYDDFRDKQVVAQPLVSNGFRKDTRAACFLLRVERFGTF